MFGSIFAQIGDVREMKGKDGRNLKRLELKLFDQTSKSFSMTL